MLCIAMWCLICSTCNKLSRFSSFQAILAAKEIELAQYKSLVQELKQQVTGLQMDSDKTSLAILQQVKMTWITKVVSSPRKIRLYFSMCFLHCHCLKDMVSYQERNTCKISKFCLDLFVHFLHYLFHMAFERHENQLASHPVQ